MQKINIEIIEQPGILFDNGEVFISTADIVYEEMKLYWCLPKLLVPEFHKSFTPNLADPFSDQTINEYCKWFEEKIGLKSGTIKIDTSVSYQSVNDSHLCSESVIVNSDAKNIKLSGKMAEIFFDNSQLSCAYLNEDKILSIAFDNGTGSVTIITEESHRRKGYATECLSRLIHEYIKKGKILGFGTTQKNHSAIKVAEKCQMKLNSKGYWIRIDEENSKLNFDKIHPLIQ